MMREKNRQWVLRTMRPGRTKKEYLKKNAIEVEMRVIHERQKADFDSSEYYFVFVSICVEMTLPSR